MSYILGLMLAIDGLLSGTGLFEGTINGFFGGLFSLGDFTVDFTDLLLGGPAPFPFRRREEESDAYYSQAEYYHANWPASSSQSEHHYNNWPISNSQFEQQYTDWAASEDDNAQLQNLSPQPSEYSQNFYPIRYYPEISNHIDSYDFEGRKLPSLASKFYKAFKKYQQIDQNHEDIDVDKSS